MNDFLKTAYNQIFHQYSDFTLKLLHHSIYGNYKEAVKTGPWRGAGEEDEGL